jgi:hypothetical protein
MGVADVCLDRSLSFADSGVYADDECLPAGEVAT